MHAFALRDYYWLIGYGIDSKQRDFGVLISMDTVLLPFLSFFSFRDTREENEKRKNEPPGLLALQLLFFYFVALGQVGYWAG